MGSQPEQRIQRAGSSADKQEGIRSLLYANPAGMQQTPLRTVNSALDEQFDRQRGSAQPIPRGFPGQALPGLWRRAAPQLNPMLQEQLADLAEPMYSSRDQADLYPPAAGYFEQLQPQRSLRDLYALPGQIQRAGKLQGSVFLLLQLFSTQIFTCCYLPSRQSLQQYTISLLQSQIVPISPSQNQGRLSH